MSGYGTRPAVAVTYERIELPAVSSVSPKRLRRAIADDLRDGMTRVRIEDFFEDLELAPWPDKVRRLGEGRLRLRHPFTSNYKGQSRWSGTGCRCTRMRAAITDRRWLRVYELRAYAPELNPVEKVWSTVKRRHQRSAGAHQQSPRRDDTERSAEMTT